MQGMTLYDLALEGSLVADLLNYTEGELTPEIEEKFDKILTQGPQVIEAAAMVIQGLKASAASCLVEQARLEARRISLEAQEERLKQRIVVATDRAFHGKVKTSLFTIWTQKANDSIEIKLDEGWTIENLRFSDPELVKTTYSIDTTAVRKLLDDNKQSLEQARKILDSIDSTDEERSWAAEVMQIIPEPLDISFHAGERYLRIK